MAHINYSLNSLLGTIVGVIKGEYQEICHNMVSGLDLGVQGFQ